MNKKKIKLLVLFIYILLTLLPLIVLMTFPMPEGRDFWRDFSIALGYVGLAMAGMQFIPTARLQFLSDVFDMDRIYKLHHYLSMLSVGLVFLHPAILLLNNPYTLLLLNPITAPWRAQAGILGLAGLLLIGFTSVLRKEIKLDYNTWHIIHDLLALAIAIFAWIHIYKVNFYTAQPAMLAVWVVEAIIWGGMIVHIRLLKPLHIRKRPFKVKKIIREAADTWTMVLKPDGHPGLDFNAAQVAWININTSPFTLHRNPFSISGSAHRKEELRFTIKNLGDFTAAIGELKGGERVYVDGPYGNFSIDDPSAKKGLVLIAGGIGIAPIMSILSTLSDQKDKRPVYLFYGNYDEKSIAFKEKIKDFQDSLHLQVTYTLEKPGKKISAEKGFISKQLLDKKLPKKRKALFYFICGPLPMIEAMEDNLIALDIPDKQVRTEKYEMA